MNLIGVLEGILFVVGDEGITLNQICDILNVDIEKAKEKIKNEISIITDFIDILNLDNDLFNKEKEV